MVVLFSILIIIQGMGLIPFMFYFGQDKPMEWDKEDIKVLCIAQFPIDTIMWVASFILYHYVINPENLKRVQIFLNEPLEIIGSYVTYKQAEFIISIYILALGIAALKCPQTKKGRIFLLVHVISMLSFIITIFIFC